MFNKAKDAANKLKNVTVEQANKLVEENPLLFDLKEIGINKINEVFGELNSATLIIEEAGYELTEIEVHIGFPLGITPHFVLKDNISDDKKAHLLNITKDRKVINSVLSTLFNISELQKKVSFRQFKFYEVEITLGMPPEVNIKFLNCKETSFSQSEFK